MNRHLKSKHPIPYFAEKKRRKEHVDIKELEDVLMPEDDFRDIADTLNNPPLPSQSPAAGLNQTMTHQPAKSTNANSNSIELIVDSTFNSQTNTTLSTTKRSLCWRLFQVIDPTRARCMRCGAVIRTKNGTTSNWIRHFKRKHPSDYVASKKKKQETK